MRVLCASQQAMRLSGKIAAKRKVMLIARARDRNINKR
jgi:ribosomal protein L32E